MCSVYLSWCINVSSLPHSDFTHHLVHWFLEPNLHNKIMVQLKTEHHTRSIHFVLVSTFTLSLVVAVTGWSQLSPLIWWQCHWSAVTMVHCGPGGHWVKCLHWAGHCITLGQVSLLRTWFLYNCTLSTCILCTAAPSTSSATVLARKWHYHCPTIVSSHYFIAFQSGFL